VRLRLWLNMRGTTRLYLANNVCPSRCPRLKMLRITCSSSNNSNTRSGSSTRTNNNRRHHSCTTSFSNSCNNKLLRVLVELFSCSLSFPPS
jgi:hypothetical protein